MYQAGAEAERQAELGNLSGAERLVFLRESEGDCEDFSPQFHPDNVRPLSREGRAVTQT